MAKIKYDANMGTNFNLELGGNFQGGAFDLSGHNKTSATFVYSSNNFLMVFSGEDFKAEGDVLTSGIATKIVFRDDDGDKLATISDFHKNVVDLMTALEGEVSDMLQILQQHADKMIGSSAGEYMIGEGGNDTMDGKGGGDLLSGNSGDDTMTGGAGNDRFDFYAGQSGDDVITDYEIGDEVNFDIIFVRDMTYQIVKSDRDAMFLFSDGSTLLLDGVRYADRAAIHIDDGT